MTPADLNSTFIGKGTLHGKPWQRNENEPAITDLNEEGHPARYHTDDGLIAAVNTALLLNKPLLVTGNPGTGKSELAERIAWEFQIGPVLRFEAQSLSEANDLFYRFDLVGRLAESRLQADKFALAHQHQTSPTAESALPIPIPPHVYRTDPCHFIELGPLGKAILRAKASLDDNFESLNGQYLQLKQKCFPSGLELQPRSVVLIDEIDKASRDFPNDLLNGIDRMEFRIREMDNLLIKLPKKAGLGYAIVIITSNLERDLPAPFLRRCAFYHIPDPDKQRMAEIIKARVFADGKGLTNGDLPRFYRELLDFFFDFRTLHQGQHVYEPGTTELIEVSRALKGFHVDADTSLKTNIEQVKSAISAFVKYRDDLTLLSNHLDKLTGA